MRGSRRKDHYRVVIEFDAAVLPEEVVDEGKLAKAIKNDWYLQRGRCTMEIAHERWVEFYLRDFDVRVTKVIP
jgi:hypothetical protein